MPFYDLEKLTCQLAGGPAPAPAPAPEGAWKQAAVMAIFTQTGQGVNLIFTKRSNHLNEHPGQISFPGGGLKASDQDLLSAALRETREEINLAQDQLKVIGPLAPQTVRDKWLMFPFAAAAANLDNLRADPSEVESIISWPLEDLWQQHIKGGRQADGSPACRYYLGDELLWGATARVVGRFLDGFNGAGEKHPTKKTIILT